MLNRTQDLNAKVDLRGVWPFYNASKVCKASDDTRALAMMFLQLYLHTTGLRGRWSDTYANLQSQDNTDLIMAIVMGSLFIKCSDTSYYQTLHRQISNPLDVCALDLKDDMNKGKAIWSKEMKKIEWHKVAFYNDPTHARHLEYDFVSQMPVNEEYETPKKR